MFRLRGTVWQVSLATWLSWFVLCAEGVPMNWKYLLRVDLWLVSAKQSKRNTQRWLEILSNRAMLWDQNQSNYKKCPNISFVLRSLKRSPAALYAFELDPNNARALHYSKWQTSSGLTRFLSSVPSQNPLHYQCCPKLLGSFQILHSLYLFELSIIEGLELVMLCYNKELTARSFLSFCPRLVWVSIIYSRQG